MIRKNIQKNKGFTLVEMMVSVSIFAIVMVMSLGALVMVLDANRKTQALKSVMNNLNFALESMTREIRFGMQYTSCGSNGSNCIEVLANRDVDGDGDYDGGDTIRYYLDVDGTQLMRRIGNSEIPVTASEVKIDTLSFTITKNDVDDSTTQPKVFLIVKGYAEPKTNLKTEFNLQTTISQRCFDEGGCGPN